VKNWVQTGLGKEFDIYEEEGEPVGQQYITDTGPLDILAVSKDKKRLLVVELKKGRASDVVVGQILRYILRIASISASQSRRSAACCATSLAFVSASLSAFIWNDRGRRDGPLRDEAHL
jgi:hypothetical protein